MKKIIIGCLLLFAVAGVAISQPVLAKKPVESGQTHKKHMGKKHTGKKHHHKHRHKKVVK